MNKKIERDISVLALKIAHLLVGLTYNDIGKVLIVVNRIVEDNAVLEKIISVEKQ